MLDISPLTLTNAQWQTVFDRVGPDLALLTVADLAHLLAEAQRALHPGLTEDHACQPLQGLGVYATGTRDDETFLLTVATGNLCLTTTAHLEMRSFISSDGNPIQVRRKPGIAFIRSVLSELISLRNRLLVQAAIDYTELQLSGVHAYAAHAGLDVEHLARLNPDYRADLTAAVDDLVKRHGAAGALTRMREFAESLDPLVTIQAGQLICPVCEAADIIGEDEVATRTNMLIVDEDDDTILTDLGDSHFERECLRCTNCDTTVRLYPRDEASLR
ncbi:hypothetical protein [Nonomuraea sp. NPDC049695]|uniref:hypothetical protein n=1 Tax=Nonomuraea sp. NPDC049695 TaxID=3154734 RepID=UPI003419D794